MCTQSGKRKIGEETPIDNTISKNTHNQRSQKTLVGCIQLRKNLLIWSPVLFIWAARRHIEVLFIHRDNSAIKGHRILCLTGAVSYSDISLARPEFCLERAEFIILSFSNSFEIEVFTQQVADRWLFFIGRWDNNRTNLLADRIVYLTVKYWRFWQWVDLISHQV